jgi:hypothetical protein
MIENSSHVIGIDLGTTNTTLSYVAVGEVDAVEERVPLHEFAIPQVVAPGAVEPRPMLPSVLYVAGGSELPPDSLHLPWRAEQREVLGVFAREQGAKIPSRLIHSSKSWLCHGGVDREEAILPWQSPQQDAKRSPAEVAERILVHLKEAWNAHQAATGGTAPFQDQQIVLCVPASFDAEARNLTVSAAQRAGLRDFLLLEEPQAALYSWIQRMGRDWRSHVKVGDIVLVVDVGGGTTDFSLIVVTESEGDLQLNRIAVGEHILLGGDNMDLALAFTVRQQLETERGTTLDAFQMMALTQECRRAKERMLLNSELASTPVTLLGQGSSLIGGTITTELQRSTIDHLMLEGFFPRCKYTDRPARPKRAGFVEAGLPYAHDGAVTRHLARFLGLLQNASLDSLPNHQPGSPILPTKVLFNGGVFHAEMLRARVMEVLESWAAEVGVPGPEALAGTDLDLAVSRGAAYFGVARRGRGVRIRGGSARSYYVGFELPAPAVPGVEPPVKLLCVVPYGMEEGTTCDISGARMDLCMWKGEPVEFRFFSSTSRRNDQPGAITDFELETCEEHNALETVVGAQTSAEAEGEAVKVDLRSHLTEIGVLELNVVERAAGEAHKLEFNVRH